MELKYREVFERLKRGNEKYIISDKGNNDVSPVRRHQTAQNGQRPCAVIVACSDSRVVPEYIFSADLGELFVIRVAGNVLDSHQIGSIEYAAGHLGIRTIIVLGHTRCGAIAAAMEGGVKGFVKSITDDILGVIGDERDDRRASEKNVRCGVERIRREFESHPHAPAVELDVIGAIYDIDTGRVDWLEQ